MPDRRIFVSYSHKDRKWAERLFDADSRTTLGRVFHTIDSQRLVPGDDYDEVLRDECMKADAFVLLVSRHFLVSDYVTSNEWQWIREGRKRICWIPIGNLDSTKSEILDALRRLHTDVSPGEPLPETPPEGEAVTSYRSATRDAIARMLDPIGAELRKKLAARHIEDVIHIADGEISSIYSARGPAFGTRFAVKVARDSDRLPLFLKIVRQATVLSKIPNFIAVYDADDRTRPYYCLTEFIDGCTMAQYIANRRAAGQRIECETVHHVLLKLALALQSAHRQGFPHLNIKPSNIMFDEKLGEPHLSPTRRSRELFGPLKLPSESSPLETLAYWLPEMSSGDWDEESADIYALGLVAFQMLTHELPQAVTNLADLQSGDATEPRFGPLPDVLEVRPDCPMALALTVMRMTNPDPRRRYKKFSDVIGALMQWPGSDLARVEQSWRRCLEHAPVEGKDLLAFFYVRFFKMAPEAMKAFSNPEEWPTKRQRNLLRGAVLQLFRYYELRRSFGDVPEHLNPLVGSARQHAQRPRITTGQFANFRDALLDTVGYFDDEVEPDADEPDETLLAWRRVLDPGVRYMRRAVAKLRTNGSPDPA